MPVGLQRYLELQLTWRYDPPSYSISPVHYCVLLKCLAVIVIDCDITKKRWTEECINGFQSFQFQVIFYHFTMIRKAADRFPIE